MFKIFYGKWGVQSSTLLKKNWKLPCRIYSQIWVYLKFEKTNSLEFRMKIKLSNLNSSNCHRKVLNMFTQKLYNMLEQSMIIVADAFSCATQDYVYV